MRDFDQVHIGVAEIHGEHRPSGAISCHWAGNQLHAASIQMRNNPIDGRGRDKANVAGTGGGFIGHQIALASDSLQVDFLRSKS